MFQSASFLIKKSYLVSGDKNRQFAVVMERGEKKNEEKMGNFENQFLTKFF